MATPDMQYLHFKISEYDSDTRYIEKTNRSGKGLQILWAQVYMSQ